MKKYILIFAFAFIIGFTDVFAQTYTNSNNLFDSTTSQQLYNIALVQKEDFLDYNYVMFQNDTSYYMIIFKDYTYKNNSLQASDTTIIHYYRESSNYNYTYTYNMYDETLTTFNPGYIFVSNLSLNKSSGSPTHQDLKDNKVVTQLLMLMVALTLASFLCKERSYI